MADLRAIATLGYRTSAVGAVKLRSVANLGYFVADLGVIVPTGLHSYQIEQALLRYRIEQVPPRYEVHHA